VFLTQIMKRADGKTIKFEIWDTAGQENILHASSHLAALIYITSIARKILAC
jgi:GTPase SAR1 family protein